MKTNDIILLTIGSVIMFNGRKCVVTHTYSQYDCGARVYRDYQGKRVDITHGWHGFLKDVETGIEQRSYWCNIPRANVISIETFDLDRVKIDIGIYKK
jgi:hypothetical protein